MIAETLNQKISQALKAGDSVRVSTLRLLSNALHNEKIAKGQDLTEEDETKVLQRQVKQRKESIEAYQKGGRQELADKEQKELEILQEFLPKEMTDQELAEIIQQTVSKMDNQGMQDFGRVMGKIMPKIQGRASGERVASSVRQILSQKR